MKHQSLVKGVANFVISVVNLEVKAAGKILPSCKLANNLNLFISRVFAVHSLSTDAQNSLFRRKIENLGMKSKQPFCTSTIYKMLNAHGVYVTFWPPLEVYRHMWLPSLLSTSTWS